MDLSINLSSLNSAFAVQRVNIGTGIVSPIDFHVFVLELKREYYVFFPNVVVDWYPILHFRKVLTLVICQILA